MLRAERSPLSMEVATELRDALSRRQKELPARWLAALDATTLREGTGSLPSHEHDAIESDLVLRLLRDKSPTHGRAGSSAFDRALRRRTSPSPTRSVGAAR